MRSIHPFDQEEVMAYLDGEISANRAAEIALHMQECAECQMLAASFRNLSQHLAAWEVESSPAQLTELLKVKVAGAPSGRMPTVPGALDIASEQRIVQFFRSSSVLRWAGAAVALIILLVIAARPNLFRVSDAALHALRQQSMPAVQPGAEGIVGGSDAKTLPLNGRNVQGLTRLQPGNAAPAPPPPPPNAPPATSSAMIARTASLSLIVKDFAAVESAVKSVTARHSGYIGELSTAMPPEAAKTLSATLRIPSAQLDTALAELKQLGRVDQETQGGEEVTKQYTDLVARLKNSRATEQRLLDVLRNNTGKVKDVLEVENEIARVRGEIEEMEADQRALQTRVDFATITLSVTEEYKASLQGSPASISMRLHNSFVEGYLGVVENVIGLLAWLLEAGPTLLLWAAILFFPARWAWRRVRRIASTKPAIAA
jgi:hypothetical protein